jgi:methyl-accepting chemotaxis protein
MIKLRDMKIRSRLILLFILIGTVPVAIAGFISHFHAAKALTDAEFEKLISVRDNRAFQVHSYFDRILSNAKTLAKTREVNILYEALAGYHTDMKVGPDAPFNVSDDRYIQIWNKHIPYFQEILKEIGFYDLFLICESHGHVMFTVAKENDLGTNLRTGPYKDSGLARLWHKVIQTNAWAVEDTSPYGPSNNKLATFAGAPIWNEENQVIGVIGFQLAMDELNRIMGETSGMGETGGTYLVGPDYLMRSDSPLDHTPDTVSMSFSKQLKMNSPSITEALSGKTGNHVIDLKLEAEAHPVLSAYRPVSIADTTWALIAEIDLKEAYQDVRMLRNQMAGVGLITILMVIFLGIIVAKSFTRPVEKIAGFTRQFGEGDLTASVHIESKDEIGDMAGDIHKTLGNLRTIIKELANTTNSLLSSSEELSAVSTQMASSAEEMNTQADHIAETSEQISASVSAVASAAEQSSSSVSDISAMTEELSVTFSNMTSFARRTSENVKNMAHSSNEIASRIHHVAASVEEMTASLNEVAKHTAQANYMSQRAGRRTKDVNTKMDALVTSSKQIGKLVGIIKDIADQTKMLALNATIEAAGAGKAGKGFAVVAGEIKELAKQSADATDVVSEQTEEIQRRTHEVVEAITEISQVIGELENINGSIASSTEEQTAAANEISKSVSANASVIRKVAEDAGESSQLVEEIAKSTAEASNTAKEVAMHVEGLANGTKYVAQSSDEVSRGVRAISKKMQTIRSESKETAMGAAQTNAASAELARMAAELSEMVSRFKI